MTRPPVDEIELNAYVDGELAPDRAAEIARRAARDPDLATHIAELHRLKAAVAGTLGPDALPLPRMTQAPARMPRRRWRWSAGLAAALVLGVAIGGAAVLRMPASEGDPAVALHDAWIESGTQGPTEAPVWLTSVIEATGLRLVRSAPLTSAGLPAGRHFAFVGKNACRLSFFEMQAANTADSALTLVVQGNLRSAHWRVDEHAYLVIARNMDGARFATIAAALGEATASRAAPDEDRIALLNAARQRCLS